MAEKKENQIKSRVWKWIDKNEVESDIDGVDEIMDKVIQETNKYWEKRLLVLKKEIKEEIIKEFSTWDMEDVNDPCAPAIYKLKQNMLALIDGVF